MVVEVTDLATSPPRVTVLSSHDRAMSKLGVASMVSGAAFIYAITTMALLLGAGIFAAYGFLAVSLYFVLRIRSFKSKRVGELTEAIALIASGDHVEGTRALENYNRRVRFFPGLHTMGLLYMAHACLLGGDYGRARAILAGLEGTRWIERGTLRASYMSTYVSTWVMTTTLLGKK